MDTQPISNARSRRTSVPQLERPRWRAELLAFAKSRVALLTLLGFGLITLVTVTWGASHEREVVLAEVEHVLGLRVDRLQEDLEADLEAHAETVRFLAALPPIGGIIRARGGEGIDTQEQSTEVQWKKRLITIFKSYLRTEPNAHQLRYIGLDDGGREIVRVERQGGRILVVPERSLQQKAERPYFKNAVSLAPFEVYVSTIDLNRERGKIQTPHLPTQRFATPVFGADGEPFGIVILNVSVEGWLRDIEAQTHPGLGLFVMNPSGDYVFHPNSEKTFGFEQGKPQRFHDDFVPIASEDKLFQRVDESGLATYREGGQLRHAVVRDVPLGSSRDEKMRVAAAMPDRIVEQRVRLGMLRTGGLLGLLCGGVLVLLFFYWTSTQRSLEIRGERLRLAEVVDNSNEAVIVVGLDGRVQSWNHAAELLFGYSRMEAVGKLVHHLIGKPGDVDMGIVQLLAEQAGNAAGFETQRRRKNGSLVDVSVTISALHDVNGNVVGAAKVLRDISEEKAYQERIEALNSSLENEVEARTRELSTALATQEAILSSAGYAIFVMDEDGVFLLVNPAAEDMLRIVSTEVVGKKNVLDFFDPQQLEKRRQVSAQTLGRELPGFEALRARVGQEPVDDEEWRFVRSDEECVPVRLRLSRLVDVDQKPMGYLGIAIDQTQHLQREAALKHAQEQAEAASEAKSRFLANMSHEIRTPMNAVQGMLQLLQRTRLDSSQRSYAEKAQSASKTLLGIINDILDFSKIEANKLSLYPQRFRLDDALRELGAMVSTAVGDKELDILYDIDPETPECVVGDALRLQQVLLNLLSNAIKFTEEGEVIVSLESHWGSDGHVELCFEVSDTGVGMSPDELQRVFQDFEQAQSSTTRKFGGTGLGLSISRRLVELMGGKLTAESYPGRGTSFSFSVQMLVGESSANESDGLEKKANDLRDLAVLIVNDKETATRVLSRIVRSLGWTVSSTSTLVAAREALARGKFEVVIWEQRMISRASGEVLEELVESTCRSTCLLLSSGVPGPAGERGKLVDHTLSKPVTGSTLFDAVASSRLGTQRGTPSSTPGQPRLVGTRVLLVEDVPVNRVIAEELLKLEGATVTSAEGGLVALEILEREPEAFDVVLMDVQMPDLDGLNTTSRIRGDFGLTELPIIAMTANAMKSDRYACLAAGMNDHVGKPFHIDQLVACIRHYVVPLSPRAEVIQPTRSPPSNIPLGQSPFSFDEALERLGNNGTLFLEQTRVFRERFGEVTARLRKMTADEHTSSALVEVHSLKGAASTLGAMRLARAAASLERRMSESDELPIASDESDALLRELESALLQACSEFEAWERTAANDNVEGVQGAPAVTSAGSVEECLEQLEQLLEASNTRALSFYEGLSSNLGIHFPKLQTDLGEAIGELEFEKALEVCRLMRGKVAS